MMGELLWLMILTCSERLDPITFDWKLA
jgi:hypothetical protein